VRIDLDEAAPGMRITDDVLLPKGGVLVKAPVVLTDTLIATLRKHDIKQIEIAPPGKPASPQPTEKAESTAPTPADGGSPAAEPLPGITVTVSSDLMSASLRLEPGSGEEGRLTPERLAEALFAEGVIHGIRENLLDEAVEKWRKVQRLYDFKGIAVGEPPVPGREGPLEFEVKHITNPAHLEAARNADHAWQLLDLEIPIQQVNRGMTIARRRPGTPPSPGRNVRGEEVTIDDVITAGITIDETAEMADNERDVIAAIDGLAYLVDKTVGVVPIDFDATVELEVSADRMQAMLTCHPALERGRHPKENEIRDLLADKSIVHGIKEEELTTLRKDMAKGDYPDKPVVVAEGTAPIDGENGRVEFLFNTETTLTPRENPDGTVDYKNVDIVQSVSTGTELARLLPPGKGTPGVNIFGEELPCREGSPAELPAGANTEICPEKQDVLIATTDGIVRYNGKVVEISEGYVISGDVDFSTGNVKYEKSVIIGGDVKSGFSVECGGDLQVSGTIEDAQITCGGNVLCKLGFVGSGKGTIEATGDVNIGFMKNQTVRARGNVSIAREAMNCTICTRRSITVNGNPLSVAGGTLVARNGILLYTVGNASGIRTLLEVGLDFTLTEEFEKTERQIAELGETHRKLLGTAKKYDQLRKVKKKLSPKEEFLFVKLRNTVTKYSQQMKTLEERKKIIQAKMHDLDKAQVKVDHAAMPGTMVKIGERHFLVREEIAGPKTIRLVRHEIRVI
jgi:hypothetical protein